MLVLWRKCFEVGPCFVATNDPIPNPSPKMGREVLRHFLLWEIEGVYIYKFNLLLYSELTPLLLGEAG